VGAAGYWARKGLDMNEVLSLAKTMGKGTCLDLQLVVQNLVLILTLATQEKKGVLKEDGIKRFLSTCEVTTGTGGDLNVDRES
jgi:hypothetical protein